MYLSYFVVKRNLNLTKMSTFDKKTSLDGRKLHMQKEIGTRLQSEWNLKLNYISTPSGPI